MRSRAIAEFVLAKRFVPITDIFKARPGGLNESKIRHCVAYLETAGVIRYVPPNGKPGCWTITSYALNWLRGGLIDGCDGDDWRPPS